MKKILLYLLFLISGFAKAQAPVTPSGPVTTQFFLDLSDSSHWTKDSRTGYFKLNSGGGGGTVPGGPITSIPVLAFNPGTGLSPAAWIQATYYASQPPTAVLTGGQNNEKSGANLTHNLSWTYGRQSNTGNIVSADITPGPFHKFSTQPGQPGSVSGPQSVTTTANVPTTYTFLVTDANGKTASSSTSDTWYDKKYYGWVADTTNISVQGTYNDAILRALVTDNAGTVKAATFNAGNTTAQYLVFMYPASNGALTSITINGIGAIGAFQHCIRNFTNGASSPFTQSYFIYWTINAQTTTTGYPVTTN